MAFGRALAVVVMTAAALAVTVTPAAAQSQVGTVDTHGCDGAPTWTLGVRTYGLEPTTKLPETIGQIDEFAQTVGAASGCGVRIHADVFTMPGTFAGYPRDADEFRQRFDAGFYVYPARGDESYVGETDYQDANFPAGGLRGQPYKSTLTHEWLHIVAAFYRDGHWPARTNEGDVVHQAVQLGYPNTAEGWITFYSDLVGGRAAGYGLTHDQWGYWGTPLRPLHRSEQLGVVYDRTAGLIRLLGLPEVFAGRLQGSLAGTTETLPLTFTHSARERQWQAKVTAPAGRYRVCVSADGDERYVITH
jgi:hypothetical protein